MNAILTAYDWIYGIAQLAAAILSVFAGGIAAQFFVVCAKRKTLSAWRYLAIALILFTIEELLGTLATFGIFVTSYLTHVVPTFILGFLIAALITQININKGCLE